MAGGSDGDLLKAAERVWGILDKLAEDNPEEYKKFVKQQLDEGKEALAAPEPRLCLRCSINRSRSKYRYLFVNVCGWSRVPRPKTDEDSIPVKGGCLRHILLGQNKRKTEDLVYDLAFHPSVLDDCLKDSQLMDMLLGLCLDYIDNEVDLCLQDRRNCKRVGIKHKGPLEDIRSSIDEEWRHCLPAEVRLDLEPQAVLSKIKEMKTKKEEDAAEESLTRLNISVAKSSNSADPQVPPSRGSSSEGMAEEREETLNLPTLNPSPVKQALIEELQSTTEATYSSTGEWSICNPEHSMAVVKSKLSSAADSTLLLTVKLPGVLSVKDVELEVSECDLELSVPGKYHLSVEFPRLVEDDQTKAQFNRTTSELVVTVPCLAQ